MILVLLPFKSAQGQHVKFQLFYKHICTDTIQKAKYFCLLKDSIEFPSYYSDSGTIYLPDTGYYALKYADFNPLYNPIFHITKNPQIDTLILPRVSLTTLQSIGPTTYVYMDCKQRCNGRIIEYWDNGKIKLLGNFENGFPKDTLYRADKSGQVVEFRVKTRKFEYQYQPDSSIFSKTNIKNHSVKVFNKDQVIYEIISDRNRDLKSLIYTDSFGIRHIFNRRQKFKDLRHDAKYVYIEKGNGKCRRKVIFYWRGTFPMTYEMINKDDIIREKITKPNRLDRPVNIN